MSLQQFDDDCPGCKPAVLDPKTNEVLPDDHPVMVAIFAVWETTTPEERKAFHDVCCLNSQQPHDMALMQGLVLRIQLAIHKVPGEVQ